MPSTPVPARLPVSVTVNGRLYRGIYVVVGSTITVSALGQPRPRRLAACRLRISPGSSSRNRPHMDPDASLRRAGGFGAIRRSRPKPGFRSSPLRGWIAGAKRSAERRPQINGLRRVHRQRIRGRRATVFRADRTGCCRAGDGHNLPDVANRVFVAYCSSIRRAGSWHSSWLDQR